MERIFRGVLRFSSGGFTNLRIARKFSASALRSTSAHTGRLASLRGLFCLLDMALPKKLVYAIRRLRADSHFGCREKDNPLLCKWSPEGRLEMTCQKPPPFLYKHR